MQNQRQPSAPAGSSNTTSDGAPASTNNDANLLSHPLKRLSLHTAANVPLPSSPGLNSPRPSRESQRTPSSPGFPPSSVRRSPSVVSLNRAASPALGKKSSNSSLRGEYRGDTPGTPRPPPSRRSSYNPNMPSPMGGAKSPLLPQVEEKPPLRACDIAEENFTRELASHEGENGGVNPGTIVIVHDQCYGHRFSRPKTPKSTLSLIMERPERILASVLGISAAYVRLGERHSEGSSPLYPGQNVPERFPFKIRKTSRTVDITSQVVTNVHGTKWMEELKTLCDNAARKLATNGKELVREAPTIPGQPPKSEFHSGDLYLCSESLNAFQGALGGVLDAVDAVFQNNGTSRAFVCVRPPGHHCSADFPSGFCWLNNVHVGIEHAMMKYGVTHAAIIDFDLHHGDGSQAITWERNKKVQNMSKNTPNWKKTSIGYFSLHDINSYPCEEGDDEKVQAASLCLDQAHGQSIWNVHLQVWKTPEEFWQIYEEKYLVLLEKTRQYLKFHTNRLRNSPNHPAPKAAIFLSAGFDASEWETAGMQRHAVNVPTEFYARFTRDVVRLAEEEGTGVGGRIISVLEGGYSNRALASGVFSHISGLTDGQVFTDAKPSKGLAFDMQQRMGSMNLDDGDIPMQSTESEPTLVTYDPQWWHASKLTELENLTDPAPAVVPKKPRNGPAAHFSSPTQSFTAKVVDPSKLHRQSSGRFTASPSRAPTPPPPEVDWATAAHSLSKLLIPSDRQTRSFKAEELSEPKVKKEKPVQSALASVHVDPSGRQLRGRKPVATYADPDSDDDKKSVRTESRANRRKTIADFPLASAEPPVPTRSASRRMSIASSVGSVSGDKSITSHASSVAAGRRSVAPTQPTSNGVQVKKARGTTAATASRVPKPPPVPRVPSNYMSKTSAPKGKENDEMDALTTGLKRITLKLPSREEYEAREKEKEEKQKALEAAKKPASKTTKKTPATRTTKTAAKPATAKRGVGRPPKASKPPSPVDTKAQAPSAEEPKMQRAAVAPLEQPQPLVLEQTAAVIQQPLSSPPPQQENQATLLPLAPVRRQSVVDVPQPPTDLMEMSITPEQLPKPSFVTSTEPLPLTTSPPRPDTPPPPPPSSVPQFVNYTTQTFGAVSTSTSSNQVTGPEVRRSTSLQWLPPNSDAGLPSASPTSSLRPLSPASKREDLPIFTASGTIPFATNPNAATTSVDGRSTPPPPDQDGTDQSSKIKAEERDVWEVPDTPAH